MPEPESSGSGSITLAVFGVAILVNLVISIVLVAQLMSARKEIAALSDHLATRQDVAMLKPIRASEILEKRCEQCHTSRRFSRLKDMTPSERLTTIQRMRSHPGADIPGSELQLIEASLLVFRCTACHGDAVISQVGLMPHADRLRFLRQKVAMENSPFRVDQVRDLDQAFDVLIHSP
jgi:hypothetical protein